MQWTPSNCIVGRAAQLEQFRNTTCTIIRNKQLLNDGISQSELDDLRSRVAYKINKNDSNAKYELLCDGKQQHVSPREVAALIFKKIHCKLYCFLYCFFHSLQLFVTFFFLSNC